MAKIVNLKDSITQEIVYPITKTNLVVDANGVNVDSKIVSLENQINNITPSSIGAVESNSAISAATSGYKFPLWDTKGLITGTSATAVTKSITLNGSSLGNVYSSSSTSMNIYAPTSVGTSGYVLKSNGSGPPTWVNPISIASTYDLTITTQSEFESFYATLTAGTCTAKSVLFVGDGGTLEFTRSDGKGLKIPSTLKNICGVNNAKIKISNFQYNSSNLAGLWYATIPTTQEYFIRDLNITCDGTTAGQPTYVIARCKNIEGCSLTSSAVAGSGSFQHPNSGGFYECDGISNCNTSITTFITTLSSFIDCNYVNNCYGSFETCSHLNECDGSFEECSYLVNCVGSIFDTCKNLVNCSCNKLITTNYSTSSYGFSNCEDLTNCFALISNNDTETKITTCEAFKECSRLTNCVGKTAGNIVDGYAFSSCIQLSNCIGIGVGTTSGYCFYNCSYVNGCKSAENPSTTSIWGGTNTYRDDNTCELDA